VSSGTSTYIEVFTSIEAQDIAGSGWNYNSTSSYITLSFWVRSSLAGTYYSIIRSFDGSIKYYTKAFTLSADTWTKVTYSVPGHSDLAFDNDTGNGLRVAVIPYYGTDYTDNSVSTDTWFTLSGGNHMPDYLQNWANTASATFDLTGVQLEVGSVATPFEHRSYGDELARCQRYFEVGRPMGWIVSKYNSSQSYGLCHTFVVEKRATPSVTPPSSVIMAHGSGQGSFTNASVTTADITNRAYTNYINAGAYSTYFCYIASGEVFTFSAEL
jgi:hypothetical protein